MKVFKFYFGESYWAYSGETLGAAMNQLFDEVGEMDLHHIEEIPESKWDEKFIDMYEDNDIEKASWKASVRELMTGNYPQFIFSNDPV